MSYLLLHFCWFNVYFFYEPSFLLFASENRWVHVTPSKVNRDLQRLGIKFGHGLNHLVFEVSPPGCGLNQCMFFFFKPQSGVSSSKPRPKSDLHMGVSKNRGSPKWMVKIMVPNPMNKWMIWGEKTLFLVQHPYILMGSCPHNFCFRFSLGSSISHQKGSWMSRWKLGSMVSTWVITITYL